MAAMQRLFQLMADKKASDLFISVGAPINIKINGVAMPVNPQVMTSEFIQGLLAEVLSAAELAELARELELNSNYSLEGVGNFRISAFQQKGTPALVVRYIPVEIPPLDSLNVPPILAELIMEKHGLILMVGATGAGKTTTLTSMLDYRNAQRSGHILTLEDPIEFIFKNRKSIVNQREIGQDTHDFQRALKNALRQTPDCIFIGEVRDRDTMTQAIAYAQSGHLCLATLHANNSYHALSRIISLYPLENRPALLADLAVTLRAIISQRLIKKPDGSRIPAVEVMRNSRHIGELIEKGDMDGIRESMDNSMTPGSQTFEQALYKLYKAGSIELDAASAAADSANNLMFLINNDPMKPNAVNKPAHDAPSLASTAPSFSDFKLDA